MAYTVKEIYYTLQGEGARTGRAAVFCRFAGCNLWSGREEDRAAAACWFCDTDFVGTDGPGGGRFAYADELATAIAACWRRGLVVGEARAAATSCSPAASRCCSSTRPRSGPATRPASRSRSRPTGRSPPPPGIDWLTVSPKPGSTLVVDARQRAQARLPAGRRARGRRRPRLRGASTCSRSTVRSAAENTARALDYCRRHPRWRREPADPQAPRDSVATRGDGAPRPTRQSRAGPHSPRSLRSAARCARGGDTGLLASRLSSTSRKADLSSSAWKKCGWLPWTTRSSSRA